MSKLLRDEKLTRPQKEWLVNFMETHLEFARGKLLSIEERIESNSLWVLLAQQLNNIGPEKTVQKWQRVWTQLKTKVKRKAVALELPLTDIEEKIIFITSKEEVYELKSEAGPSKINFNSWVEKEEIAEDESDLDSLNSFDASFSEEEQPTTVGPKRQKKSHKVAEAIYSFMEQSEATNNEIKNLVTEVRDVKNVLSEMLEEHKNTNNFLERIACALENKK